MKIRMHGRTAEIPLACRLGTQNDDRVETVVFELPCLYGNVDLSMAAFYLAYATPSGEKGLVCLDKTIVDDAIELVWQVGCEVTREQGLLRVQLVASGLEDRLWHSRIMMFEVAESILAETSQMILYRSTAPQTAEPKQELPILVAERRLLIPEHLQNIAVQNDDSAQTVTIQLPRWYDGNDLAQYTILLKTLSSGGEDDILFTDRELTEDTIRLRWTLRPPQTSYPGRLELQLCISGEGFRWQSEPGSVNILRALEGEPVIPVAPAILEELSWRVQSNAEAITALGGRITGIDQTVQSNLQEINTLTDSMTGLEQRVMNNAESIRRVDQMAQGHSSKISDLSDTVTSVERRTHDQSLKIDDLTSAVGDCEDRITNLETDVTALKNDRGELTIPDYWLPALEEGAEAINTALCAAGGNKSAFLFYSDTHWNYGSQMSPTLLKYLYRHTGMTKTFFGGDIVNDEATDYDTMEYLWDWRNQLKDLPNHHSAVGNHDDGNATNNLFSEQYVYGYLLAAEETPDIVRGDGMYYYIDSPAEKTRYIFLDTAYQGVDTAQTEFVSQALLSAPDGWHIVAISHIWHDTDWSDSSNPVVGELNSGASAILSMFDAYNSRTGEYAGCGGWVEFCVGGHTHWDHDSASTTGIPIILVETDSKHTRSGLSYTSGTTTEASVNGIIADYDHHKIHVIRIGRGASREVGITNDVVSYTNVLPLATENDGVTVYNADDTPGYKADTRWSNSSVAETAESGVYLTGFIPVSAGAIVRFRNITLPNSTGNDGVIYTWSKSSGITGAYVSAMNGPNMTTYWNAVWGDDGNLEQITFPSSSIIAYIRIQCGGIDGTSIITVNEPIE